MTKREFRRLRAGNLVQEEVSQSLWVVVDRRQRHDPCLIVERAVRRGTLDEAGIVWDRVVLQEGPLGVGSWQNVWAVLEEYHEYIRRLA